MCWAVARGDAERLGRSRADQSDSHTTEIISLHDAACRVAMTPLRQGAQILMY